MGATESLRREHQILRAKLKLLAVAMQMGPDASFVLREMCWSLARMLEQHIQREAEALRPYSDRIQALTQARMAQDHADQQTILRDVNILLVGRINALTSQVILPLAHLIDELREHMDEEECELFPMVDRIAEVQPQGSGLAHDAAGGQDHCDAAERCEEVKTWS